jgi:hypothetical protein
VRPCAPLQKDQTATTTAVAAAAAVVAAGIAWREGLCSEMMLGFASWKR